MTWLVLMGPKMRLSRLLVRLSPQTKISSASSVRSMSWVAGSVICLPYFELLTALIVEVVTTIVIVWIFGA
jgi:hypothetical protein